MGTVDRADTAGGSIKQGSEARDWFWTGLTRSTSHGARHKNSGLQPLNEDGPPPSTFESPERQQSPPIADNDIGMTSSNQNETETSSQERSGSSPTGLTRARSTNQMRDIRDQMQDLKGKISSLKQRAREDSLRRRSLQSLRTPSPFTAAEQWYSGAPTYGRDQSKSMPHEGSPPAIQPAIEEEDEAKHYPVQAPESIGEEAHDPATNGSLRHSGDSEKDVRSMDVPISRDTDDSPRTVIDASAADDEGPANQAPSEDKTLASNQESGKDEGIESEEEDLDESSALPIGGRHEDRPDAFDYEHLFLHSGMGTLGREGKSRSSSHSSMYSVETTKPTNVTTEANEVSSDGGALARADDDSVGVHRNSGHERKGSVESVSTVATFATATEGEGKSSGEDTDEDDWAYRRPMAGSWEPEQPSHRKATSGRKDGPQQSATATKHTPQNWSPRVTINTGADSTGSAREAQTDSTLSPTAMPDLLAFLTSKLPTKDGIAPQSVELNDSDKELAERLVRSVAQVCSQLQAFSMERNKYGGRPWRRRLDGARRVLDGETNGEVF